MYKVIDDSNTEHFEGNLLDIVCSYYTENDFNDFLDTLYEPIVLFNLTYAFSQVYAATDLTAYRESYFKQCETIAEKLQKELEEGNGSAYFYNGAHIFDLKIYKEEDDD